MSLVSIFANGVLSPKRMAEKKTKLMPDGLAGTLILFLSFSTM
jgi:hypothetical protein